MQTRGRHRGQAAASLNYSTFANGNVILVRGEDSNSGHMWIFDGYTKTVTRGGKIVKTEYTVHCNWGWGGTANGWYTDYYAPSTGGDYGQGKGYIYFN